VKPFAIAGLQMPVSATESNLEAMQHHLDALMYIYPWVQMVVFSELVTFGPSPSSCSAMVGKWSSIYQEELAGRGGAAPGGVPGTPAAKVTIIGGGVVGTEAAKIAVGMRAMNNVLDVNPKRLAYLSGIFGGRIDLVIPNRARTAAYVKESDVVIGAVLVAGAKAPKLVSREMVASMRPGSVVVNVAID
jgi:alanine dehydrogenase